MYRSGEITYYEELGVAEDASPEEIRDSFRALVRLLHPDQQTDDQLKRIAELQMRKLNRIYAVLSDAERRRRYDDSFEEQPLRPTIVFNPASNVNVHRLMSRLAWVGAALVTCAVLIWLASESPVAPPAQGFDRANAQKQAPAGASAAATPDDVAHLRSELHAAIAERDAAEREVARLRQYSARSREPALPALAPEPPRALPPIATTMTELPAPIRSGLPAVGPPPARAQPVAPGGNSAKEFTGFWFYAPPVQGQHNKSPLLYPPEFIEAVITDNGVVVHGTYRSRYQIVDRAISPDVNFEFTATARGPVLAARWTGAGGARGDLTLKTTGENTIQIDWTASELGNTQGLASGTAKLTRRME